MKKIVNTGVTYNPVTMTVFDTVGNEWLTTLMKYFSYHFMDPRNVQKGTGPEARDLEAGTVRSGGVKNINSTFGRTSESQFNSNAAGYNLNNSPQFFERIDYILYHGNRGVQYSIINPMMSEFKPGNIDYSSSDVQEFSMTFDYERFSVFNKLNFKLGAEDLDRFEELGAISGDLFGGGASQSTPEDTEYTVQSGDTLSQIAASNGVTLQEILDANPSITNPDEIQAGQTITIPGKASEEGSQENTDVDPTKPAILEKENVLAFLGNADDSRDRSAQPTIAKEQKDPTGDGSDGTSEDDSQDGTGDDPDANTTEDVAGVPGTYSQAYDPSIMSGGAGGSEGAGGVFSDILGDVADSALSAVLRGQNVKDAVLTTAVAGTSTALGNLLGDAIKPSSTNQPPETDGDE